MVVCAVPVNAWQVGDVMSWHKTARAAAAKVVKTQGNGKALSL